MNNREGKIKIYERWKCKKSSNIVEIEESTNKHVKVRKTNIKKGHLKSLFTYTIDQFLSIYEPA